MHAALERLDALKREKSEDKASPTTRSRSMAVDAPRPPPAHPAKARHACFGTASLPSKEAKLFVRSRPHSDFRLASVCSLGQRLPMLPRNLRSTSLRFMGRAAKPGAWS